MNSQSTEKVTSIIKMVTKGKCSLNWFFKENYGDQSRGFEWILGLQGYDLEKKFDRCPSFQVFYQRLKFSFLLLILI